MPTPTQLTNATSIPVPVPRVTGLPNVGKSSLFNLLTQQAIAAENYPFCTIEPNESRCAAGP